MFLKWKTIVTQSDNQAKKNLLHTTQTSDLICPAASLQSNTLPAVWKKRFKATVKTRNYCLVSWLHPAKNRSRAQTQSLKQLLSPGCDKRFTEVFFSGNLPGGLVREQTDIFIMHTASSSACGKGRDYRDQCFSFSLQHYYFYTWRRAASSRSPRKTLI